MWQLLLSGNYSVSRVRELANDEWGIKTRLAARRGGKPLQRSHVYMIFGDPFYAGLIKYGGQIHPGQHPPMITVEEFEKVQRILGRPGAQRPKRHDFPFTGIFHCGECGAAITAEEHRKKSGRVYVYYHCTWRRGPCRQKKCVRAEEVEGQVRDFIARLSLAKPYCEWLAKQIEQTESAEATGRKVQINAMRQEIQRVSRRLGILTQLRVREELRDADYREQYNALIQEQVRLEQKVANLEERPEDWLEPAKRAISFVSLAENRFVTGTSAEKRRLLQIVGSNPTLKDGKLLITAKKPFQMFMERSSCPLDCPGEDSAAPLVGFRLLGLASASRFGSPNHSPNIAPAFESSRGASSCAAQSK